MFRPSAWESGWKRFSRPLCPERFPASVVGPKGRHEAAAFREGSLLETVHELRWALVRGLHGTVFHLGAQEGDFRGIHPPERTGALTAAHSDATSHRMDQSTMLAGIGSQWRGRAPSEVRKAGSVGCRLLLGWASRRLPTIQFGADAGYDAGAAPHDCLVFRQSVRGTRELGQAPFGLARSAWVPLTDGRPRRKSVLKPQVSLGQTHLPSVPDACGGGLLPRGLTPAPGRAGPGPTRGRARDVGPARREPLTSPMPLFTPPQSCAGTSGPSRKWVGRSYSVSTAFRSTLRPTTLSNSVRAALSSPGSFSNSASLMANSATSALGRPRGRRRSGSCGSRCTPRAPRRARRRRPGRRRRGNGRGSRGRRIPRRTRPPARIRRTRPRACTSSCRGTPPSAA